MTMHRTPRLDEQLCFALYSASRAVTRAYAPLLEGLGLTYPQYVVMLVLWEQDALSVSELGAQLGLDSGTLTPLLKRLEEGGIVTRTRGTDDARVVRIALTPAGRKLEIKAREIPAQLICRAGFTTKAASLEELGALRDRLKELTRSLDASLEAPEPARPRRSTPRAPKPRRGRAST
jgi:DNA-binding MarR family transcriptional regulator